MSGTNAELLRARFNLAESFRQIEYPGCKLKEQMPGCVGSMRVPMTQDWSEGEPKPATNTETDRKQGVGETDGEMALGNRILGASPLPQTP